MDEINFTLYPPGPMQNPLINITPSLTCSKQYSSHAISISEIRTVKPRENSHAWHKSLYKAMNNKGSVTKHASLMRLRASLMRLHAVGLRYPSFSFIIIMVTKQ